MRIVLSSQAANEFTDIADYLLTEDVLVAKQFADVLEQALDTLARHPLLGRQTSDEAVRVLTLSRFPFRIFYEIHSEELWVVSIFHTARNQE